MTEQVGDHGLFCLDDDDYAAVALAMQCNAQALDVALTDINSTTTDFLGRPWATVTNSGAAVIASGSGTLGPLNLVGEFLRPGSGAGGVPISQAYNMPNNYVAGNLSTFMPRGVYLIGASINWTLAAATANSIRQLLVYGVTSDGGPLNSTVNFTDLYRLQDYQGDGGNNGALTVVGFLDNRAGNVATFESFFSHANAGDLTVAANNWRVWATRLGSGLSF